LKNLQGPDVLKLLLAVDELNIYPLISHIQEFFIKHQTKFLYPNPIEIIETVHQHEAFTDLWNSFLEKLCEEPEVLFSSDKFVDLQAPLLELLLKRDDLNMDEIEIWEYLLKWCFAQQNMKNDPSNWNKDDITRIKNALYRFIPLIRFCDIESTDFFYKVYCYKDILPQDLIHGLLEINMVSNIKYKNNLTPSRKPLNSTLIKLKHIPIFASWINKKDSSHYNRKNIPYSFKLLYRSSQDGNDTESFHRNCDDKGATIWVAKIKNSTQLIGGYNPLDWDQSESWKTTANSFLFNFTNEEDISTAKVSYVIVPCRAAYCGRDHGPTMGDLYNEYNNWFYIDRNRYPEIGIPNKFEIEDYEVFQMVKK
jgi:hypothetical protein